MKIIFTKKCLEYSAPHIESPQRVRKAYQILKDKEYEFIEPDPVSYEDLLKVHSTEYIEKIRKAKYLDTDTPAYENIYEYARLSAGAAILAAEENGFSLMRPPGHHVGKNGKALGAVTLGFCYFNNIAVAIKNYDMPTLILDIDGHHGNGTQEIFLGNPQIKFVSLHRSPYYPGSGLESEKNCLNFPLHSSIGDELYLKTLDRALSQVNLEKIEVIAISAGFDAHKGDLASLGLSSSCFREIGRKVRDLGLRTFGVLEGGYSGKNIGEDLHQLIQGLEGK